MPVSLPFRMSRRISLGWRVSIGIAPFYLRPRRGASPVPERATTPSTSLKAATRSERSEEHTSELQSQSNLVCRLLLEKKNIYFCNFLLFYMDFIIEFLNRYDREVINALVTHTFHNRLVQLSSNHSRHNFHYFLRHELA